ncbi:kelch-like protein 23 isoform X1 [Oncorhynchus nerka]|uniref:kelch-like protein 23 isoform X1 n=1 Tax=Oncorhynchus nerka TaxID=8023 RepID=UPI0011316404|nr:kelch-like protein 23 isoform X1 [Oncorhynchus nerka]
MDLKINATMSDKGKGSYIYDFCDIAHPNELLDALREFYLGGIFTDITLQCATGQVFYCHKAALSARSSYFKVMFTADMKERSNNLIKLTGIDYDVLSALVNYVYTSRVNITETNVQSLLEAADLLQFSSVKKACEDFLIRFLDVDNCLGMHSFAELHICPELEREARRVMLSRFEDLLQQEEFLEVDYDKLSSVMSLKNINVWKDEVLLDAVVKWVTYDIVNRIDHVQGLLCCVHLELDEVHFKTALDGQGQCLLGNEGKVRSLIINALKSNCKETSASRKKVSSSMYVIGGYYWHPLCEVHIWDPISNTWVQGKDMPDQTRESYSVSLLGANIYVTGGYMTETIEALDTVWIYNGDCDEWTEGCPMITARYYHCSVALHGCIYAIGGYRGGAIQLETEFYDPLKKKWFPTANMIQGVGNATACVMNDTIYVTGGHYGSRGSSTYEKIQAYRPDINEWSIVTISPHPEYGLCSVSLNNKLYLVGGQTTITDCYDPERDEWRQLSVMKERRMECGAVVINGCIYVTGGYSYSKGTYLQSIEKYDPELDTWEVVGSLPSPARTHGCICIYSV